MYHQSGVGVSSTANGSATKPGIAKASASKPVSSVATAVAEERPGAGRGVPAKPLPENLWPELCRWPMVVVVVVVTCVCRACSIASLSN